MNTDQPQASITNDFLGFTATPPGGKAVLVFDTEQSFFDFHRGMTRALQRAGRDSCPPYLYAYSLAGTPPRELRRIVQAVCAREAAKNGIHTVIIDGIGDFVSDVNEAKESNEVVTEMHDLAIQHNCGLVLVIHENPTQTTGKSRGHLGSQLARKSETVLTLARDGEVTVVYATVTRGAPIPEKFGPRFAWSDAAGGHVSTTSQFASKEAQKVAELRELAQEVMSDAHGLKYAPFVAAIVEARNCSQKTAERRFAEMKKAGVIRRDDPSGFWMIAPA